MPSKPGNGLLDLAYALQRWAWRIGRPRTRGVKVLLANDRGEIVLIRNSYGSSHLWVLPGGGVRTFEDFEDAARREVREELGVRVRNLSVRGRYFSSSEGKRDHIVLYQGDFCGPLRIDSKEVLEARLVDPRDLPDATSPATRRRIEEYLNLRQPDGAW